MSKLEMGKSKKKIHQFNVGIRKEGKSLHFFIYILLCFLSSQSFATSSSIYQNLTFQASTPLHETDDNYQFLMAQNRDIVVIQKSGTGTNSTEVHILSAVRSD